MAIARNIRDTNTVWTLYAPPSGQKSSNFSLRARDGLDCRRKKTAI
jgi:hypothetical protein